MEIKFDTKKIMNQMHKDIKAWFEIEIKCPKCWEKVGEYTHDYLKEKWELFCEFCEDSFLVDIDYKQ